MRGFFHKLGVSGLVLALGLSTFPAIGPAQPPEKANAREGFPPEYIALARRVAADRPVENMVRALDTGEALDLPGLLASLREAEAALRSIRSDDPLLHEAATLASRGMGEAIAEAERLARGDEKPAPAPKKAESNKLGGAIAAFAGAGALNALKGGSSAAASASESSASVAQAAAGDWKPIWWPLMEAFAGRFLIKVAEKAADQGAVMVSEWLWGPPPPDLAGLRAAAIDMETVRRLLPVVARQYAPAPSGGQALAIDFDQAWNSFGRDDELRLTNVSGQDLTNCLLLIEVEDPYGAIGRDARFAASFASGQDLKLRLWRGMVAGLSVPGTASRLGRASVEGASEIRVSLWSDQLTREGLSWAYTAAERGADIERCFASLSFEPAAYTAYHDGWTWDTAPSLVVRLKGRGQDWLDNPRGAARFFGPDGQFKEYAWSAQSWDEGQEIEFEAADLAWNPRRVEITFEEIGYTHALAFSISSGE